MTPNAPPLASRLRSLPSQFNPAVLRRRSAMQAVLAAVAAGLVAAPLSIGWRLALALPLLAIALLAWRSASRVEALVAKLRHERQRAADLVDSLQRDPLTGLLNRTAFRDRLGSIARADADSGLVMVLYFDLDRFKDVNDTLGHDVGDALLRAVAERARDVLGDALAIARLGGDEFAAVLPWQLGASPTSVANQFIHAMAEPFRVGDRVIASGTSVGISIGDPMAHGADALIWRADVAMYEAKRRRRGSCHLFDDMLSHRHSREKTLRSELSNAHFDDRFELHYQPIFDARGRGVTKAEALLRPNGATLAGIAPNVMVTAAEESGHIVALTEWTLDRALRVARELDLPIAVNISPIFFRDANFSDKVIERMLAARVEPRHLVVEITEGVLITDLKGARAAIDELRSVGIQVYLDDFGTGFSSLSYLQGLDLDGLKLDRSFLRDLGRQPKSQRIVKSMIDFAHSLDMVVVTEGVESDWQARMLQLAGCDFLQGFGLGVPDTADRLRALLGAGQSADREPASAAPGGLRSTSR